MTGGDAALLTALPHWAYAFMLVVCRLGALIMVAPGFGESQFPVTLRAALAVVLSLLLLPQLAPILPAEPSDVMPAVAVIAGELAVGVWIGWLARLIALALPAAGNLISYQIGLSSVLSLDATGVQTSALTRLFGLVAPLLILTTGLYALPLSALVGSYRLFEPGRGLAAGDMAQMAVAGVAGAFEIALRLAGPFVLAGMIWQVALGLLARLVPNLQVFLLALPGQVLGGLLLLSVMVTALLGAWQQWAGAGLAGLAGG